MKVANKRARPYVQERMAFEGSNILGVWEAPNRYVVYSYGTHWPMFIWEDGQWYENEEKYSPTTSKQHTQVHPHTDTIKLSKDLMRTLASRGKAALVKILVSNPDRG